ncbi:endonuclease [Paenibacillus sp. H1-7]|uniref:endonuclease/exonuclease/phosphatase family protein n=1 Tax=Paenibacillus sp. H1-7 TaxID=2282849 RepID=UPI001EF78B5D|nr:endonuclease/exonuclease/phosphatase family protein [Paenibacillus sp. H1-7]ULL18535.1 endonuclease [Paenibacillus sp. H1-7]
MEYNMMTFNLRYHTPNDGDNAWPHRVDKAAMIIREHDPVLIGTQEGYYAMLTELHGKLQDYEWIGMGRFGGQENEHCAIFYKQDRLEVVEQGNFWLSETPDEAATKSWDSMFPRMCTWVTFADKADGSTFTVFNTHLDHHSQEARDRGVQVIWERVQQHRTKHASPVIIMGDMNSAPEDLPIRYLRGTAGAGEGPDGWLTDAYAMLEGPVGRTAHSFQGGSDGKPIDYIFVSPNVELLAVEVDRRQIDGGFPSDHYPVVASVRING